MEEKLVELTKLILDQSLEEKKTTHRTELFIISLKSLLPSEDKIGVPINYERYNKEFLLWKYYRESSNVALDNILFNFKEEIYWEGGDDSLIYRSFPIIMGNKAYETIYEEVIKNTLYTTGNLGDLIEVILLAKFFYLLLASQEDITDKLKDELINLNQEEFLESFSSYFRVDLKKYPGVFQIDFEKAKIDGLNILNGVEAKNMEMFNQAYKIYRNMEDFNNKEGLKDIVFSLDDRDYCETDIDYFRQLGSYVYNIRKSRINPKALEIESYKMPDVFEYRKGEWFDHSLLNRCQVLDRKEDDEMIYTRLKTKSGIYNFKKPIDR